jgi:thiamine-monophosphate kinase
MNSIKALGGEFELIKLLTKDCYNTPDARVALALGDDASVMKIGDKFLALSVDSFVDQGHFSWDYFSPEDIGQRVIEASFSDIVAVGAKPAWCWISIAIPDGLSVSRLEGIYNGVNLSLKRLGASLQGGETVKIEGKLTISITATGLIESENQIKKRSSAKVGDKLFISGELGLSKAGLYAFQNKIAGYQSFKDVHLRPKCRIDLLDQFSAVNAMIDISDGLASEANHIAKQSKVAIKIDANLLPISEELRIFCNQYSLDPYDLILNGGEDFELLFTSSNENYYKDKAILIGEVLSGTGVTLLKDDKVVELDSSGYNHFI